MTPNIKMAIIILLGIVLTFTVMIVGSIYNNNQNIGRDKYYAAHCQFVKQETASDLFTTRKYRCEQ